MAHSGGLSWEAQEVFQKFNRLPGAGIPMIQLNMKVGSAKTVKKGIPELKSAGLITDTASGEPTLLIKATRPPFDLPPEQSNCFLACHVRLCSEYNFVDDCDCRPTNRDNRW
jgi:hypothetical protein